MAPRPIRPTVALALVLALTVAAAACGGGGKKAGTVGPASTGKSDKNPNELMAQLAGYDLATGPAARFIVGVFNPSRGPLGYGTVVLAAVRDTEGPPVLLRVTSIGMVPPCAATGESEPDL